MKEEGEPREKKGKSQPEEDEDEEDKEGIDESPEEVQKPLSSVLSRLLAHPLSLPPPSLQCILSCHKAGSILREARDRVVSLTTDARSAVIACHVSAGAFAATGGCCCR